jgi:Site-specific recombinase XerD
MPIEKRGDTYRVRVRVRGRPEQSATFPTLAQARAWEARALGELADARAGNLPRRTVREMLDEYVKRECPKHRGARWEEVRIEKFKRTLPFIDRQLATVTPDDVSKWRDGLASTLKPSSALREYGLLRTITRTAMREWGWLRASPFGAVRPPPPGRARRQRITPEQEAEIIARLQAAGGASQIVAQAFRFALQTALRRGELSRATREHLRVPERVLWVPPSKNGDDREVPLSQAALAILPELPVEGRLFPIELGNLDKLFREARGELPITFHDSRREALTRMAKRIKDPMLLAKISGHRDLKVLMNTYYRPDMSETAALLD